MDNSLPKIEVVIDMEADINWFNLFLSSHNFRSKRPQILTYYPKLADLINSGVNEEEATGIIVSDMYKRFSNQVQRIVSSAQKILDDSQVLFNELAKDMDCADLATKVYKAMPTFLPFSPLNNNTFCFSIAKDIAEQSFDSIKILEIAVHEISHFIFFDQLAKSEVDNQGLLNSATNYYFKEALTAAIVDGEFYRTYFNRGEYKGNKDLHGLTVSKNGKDHNIVTYFKQSLSKRGYMSALKDLLEIFSVPEVQDILENKRDLWNELSTGGVNESTLIEKYQEPIVLDR